MMFSKIKRPLLIAVIALVSMIPIAAVTNNYFEISKNLDIFATLYKEVNTYYVDDVEPAKFMKSGIDAMLESLDPYTNYISEADMEGYRFQTTGKYGGIGALIRKTGEDIVISEPYENYPASKAGLMAGDVIVGVDGKSTKGKNVDDISKILKGTPGTEVKLQIQRPGEKDEFFKSLIREEIKISSVSYSGMINDEIGYIRLEQFTEGCGQEVKNALKQMQSKYPLKGIVLDLRGNPGGLLNEAVNVTNIFVEKGNEIVSTRGKVKEWDKVFYAIDAAVDTKMPLAILTNSSSASASEIVSGTVQDYDRGVIVGQKTFGKGLVQTTRQLSYGTQLKVTTAHYYTPSGRCIQAINYAQRNEDGSVGKIPDSLKAVFKTKNGRTVYDGGGVDPDLITETEKLTPIAFSLIEKGLIFDYATKFRMQHDQIAPAKTFSLDDAAYNEFISFISDKEYDYTTKSEEKLKALQEAAEKEDYWQGIKDQFLVLKNSMMHDKEQDLVKNKEQIKSLLEEEIASRYYYRNGRLEASLKDDVEVQKAIEVLTNKEAYDKVLTAQK
jgi:carboxyl-terminal processing protease